MNEVRALELIAKDLTGEINRTERGELMSWLRASEANQVFYQETKELWETSGEVEPMETMPVDTHQAWETLSAKLDDPPAAQVVSIRPKFPWWRLAAAAVLLVGGVLLWQWANPSPVMVALTTGPDERRTWTLPDESTVVLDEESILRYPENFTERRLELTGQAFFSVTANPERPFSVEANDVVTRVLGTKFTVRAYEAENSVNVQVQEGVVAVEPKTTTEETVKVTAGQRIAYQKEERIWMPLTEASPNADAFVDQILVFSDTPLREVLADMSDFYDTPLRLANPGLGNCRVNITFEGIDLDEALQRLSFISNLTINRADGALVIDGQPCE